MKLQQQLLLLSHLTRHNLGCEEKQQKNIRQLNYAL
jgi:hypothetical protein